MQETIKVHTGLTQVDRDTVYNMGIYEVEFQDGLLRFDLHVRICDDPECHCDDLQMTWKTKGQDMPVWYTSDRQWLFPDCEPMPDEMVQVFRSMEGTEQFQERYQHLMYLRRRQILVETGLFDQPFELAIPNDLVGKDGDPSRGILGHVQTGTRGERHAYTVDLCDDPQCYCRNLFLNLIDARGQPRNAYLITPDNQWQSMDDNADGARLRKIRKKLQSNERFRKLLDWLRMQRQYQNYQRFVRDYPKQTGIRLS